VILSMALAISRKLTLLLILAACLISACLISGAAAQRLINLDYSDGSPEDGLWIGGGQGHAVAFTAPSENWTLSKVAVMGSRNVKAESGIFVLEVWDGENNLLYSRADEADAYFSQNLSWSEVDLPDLRVPDTFYICLFEFSRIYVGVDLSSGSSNRSLTVSRNPNRIIAWNVKRPQDKTRWMISALGYSSSPKPELKITSSSAGENVSVTADVSDPDGNLASITMYIYNQTSGDAIWAERMPMEGSRAQVNFNWPREMMRVNSGTNWVEPVLAVKTTGLPESEAPFLAYSAPAILRLGPSSQEFTALAYFGQDGAFHSLEDLNGQVLYRSRELLAVTSPGTSFGEYVKHNLTLIEGATTLSFLKRNADQGLIPLPPLLLDRSPIQHYALSLERVPFSGAYTIEVLAEDIAGGQGEARLSPE
jgi:hypothetical protein